MDGYTLRMGINGTPVIGKIRLTAAIANSLDRLLIDIEKAKQLALKLEDELMGDDEEQREGSEAGDDAEERDDGDEPKEPRKQAEIPVPGLHERPSAQVQAKIDSLIEAAGLDGELNEEQQIRKVRKLLTTCVPMTESTGQDHSGPVVGLSSSRVVHLLLLRCVRGIPRGDQPSVCFPHASARGRRLGNPG